MHHYKSVQEFCPVQTSSLHLVMERWHIIIPPSLNIWLLYHFLILHYIPPTICQPFNLSIGPCDLHLNYQRGLQKHLVKTSNCALCKRKTYVCDQWNLTLAPNQPNQTFTLTDIIPIWWFCGKNICISQPT